MVKRLKLIMSVAWLFLCSVTFAGESFIPKKEVRLPADDLVFNGKVLRSEDALIYLRQGVIADLSELDPKNNDIWSNRSTDSEVYDEELQNLNTNEILEFEGVIGSQTGLLRFNVRPESSGQIFTVHMDKSLHTLLLRVELLRALGYKIPDIVHRNKVTVRFQSEEEKKNFLQRQIVENTLAASSRWIVKEDELTVTLKDVALTKPNELDFYNVAFGVPLLPINSRTLRSLLLPYAMLDLSESINQIRWTAGRIDNNNLILSHFLNYDFTTSLDDAQWIMKKIARLSRADFKRMVVKAAYPKETQNILVEKLIARRNSLVNLVDLKISPIEFNNKLSEGDYLVKGKLIEKDFPNYATRFAYGDAESPLQELQYYLFAKLQSNAIDNITALINEKIRAFDVGEKREEYFIKQFEDGLRHFLATGELKPIGVGAWYSPYLNGNIIVSRDIVLGNYLGTDNLIQLADTFGASVNLGLHVGVEGVGPDLTSTMRAGASLVRTYSHIKPVKTLKASIKEPYRNIFVGMLKKSLKDRFFTLSELRNLADSTERNEKIAEVLKEIAEKLDVGESLVITDRFMPTAQIKLVFNQGLVGAGLGVDSNYIAVKRLHLYKRSASSLQIYDDRGSMVEVGLTFDVQKFITLLTVRAQQDKGQYRAKVYNVNLDSNLEENPKFFENSLGVFEVLKNGNFEVLESVQKPVKLKAKFLDRDLRASFLLWKGRKQIGRAEYEMETPQGFKGKYFSLNKTKLIGFNVELFARRLANYYISEKSDNLIISEHEEQTPSDTFLGKATTDTARFEAELTDDGKIAKKFISISKEKQGWSVSEKKIISFMNEVNKRFQTTLFDTREIDFKKLRLYNLSFSLNLYEKGISALYSIKLASIEELEKKYKKSRICYDENNANRAECGDLWMIKSKIKSCSKKTEFKEIADCQLDLAESMFNDLDFSDFSQLIGKDNYYVYAGIDGFRSRSEILNDTIFSNSIGTIGSKNVSGPLDRVRELLGLQGGEMRGSWIRN